MTRRDQPKGVPKKMPEVGGLEGYRTQVKGIQKYRYNRIDMDAHLKAAWPWPGGKADIAAEVWKRFGDVPNFVEPFAGTAIVTLLRPHDLNGKTETLNDLDGFITNALRAITYAPEETAEWCDRPVNEIDLTAWHLHLKAARDELTARLFADPFYCDPMLAGAWLWGIASWIGDGWCVADGPWINVDGRLVDRRTIGADVEGVTKQMPRVGGGGDLGSIERGIQRYRNAPGVPKQMPLIAQSGYGNNQTGIQRERYRNAPGVPRKMPQVAALGGYLAGKQRTDGIQKYRIEPTALLDYFARLSDRLRRVRFLCGDWRRACKDSVTVNHGLTGVLLDPPYPQGEHDMGYHAEHGGDVWYDAAAWAVAHGDDPRLRIAVCGYWSEATDAIFPATWVRYRWQARGGYANQKADGRGRENAKRECVWFSPHCVDPANDWTGTLFAEDAT